MIPPDLDKFLDILLCNCNKQLEIWNVLEEGEGGGEGNLFWRSSLMQITKLGKSVSNYTLYYRGNIWDRTRIGTLNDINVNSKNRESVLIDFFNLIFEKVLPEGSIVRENEQTIYISLEDNLFSISTEQIGMFVCVRVCEITNHTNKYF